jgi:molybdopterin-guanine dinucleotide biosynthesis protein A
MGQDKGLVDFQGQPLIARVLARIAPIADEVIVTTNHPENYRFLGLPLFQDLLPGAGALGGLYTALNAARGDLVGVVACDMPFANPDVLAFARDWLVETGDDVAVPFTGRGMEPFHAVYRRETSLPAIKSALDDGERRLISWFPMVRVISISTEEIRSYDPKQLAFLNINTPEELGQAEILAKEIDSGGENHAP